MNVANLLLVAGAGVVVSIFGAAFVGLVLRDLKKKLVADFEAFRATFRNADTFGRVALGALALGTLLIVAGVVLRLAQEFGP